MAEIAYLFVFPLLLSMVVVMFVTPQVIKYAGRLKIVDDPKKSNHPKVIHDKPVPRGGGIPIFTAVFITLLFFIPLDKYLISILLGAFIIAVMGHFDDRYNMSPYTRLVIGFVAASIPVLTGVGISFITNPFGGIFEMNNFISPIFSILWIVFMMNVINMGAKGIDGQLSGVTVIAAITVTALSLYYSADITQWPTALLTSATAGAFLGFLFFHKYPQKIMPGYGGSTLAGYFLAIASILATTKVGTLIVVLGIPLIDTGYVIIKRILSGKSPVWGDKTHLHHKLLDLGLSKKQVSQIYWSSTAIMGILALNLNSTYKLYTIIGVALVLGVFLIWITRKLK